MSQNTETVTTPATSNFKRLVTGIVRAIRPAPKRTPWQWADAKRILPPDSPEPGRFNSNRAPWSKAISAAHSSPFFSFVLAVMGAQMGKTETLFNICGHNFDDTPRPLLWITPNRKLAESMSKNRLKKMLRGVKTLWDGLSKGKDETITEKYINGARLGFGWAGSATELASHPAFAALMDERDRMTSNVGGEGDPTVMVQARVSNYIGGTVTSVSTPTTGAVGTREIHGLHFWDLAGKEDVHSPIWKDWQGGTMHHWSWSCPHCNQYFIPRLNLLRIPDDCTAKEAFKSAALICPNQDCGKLIEERHKRVMNDTGIFISPGQQVMEIDQEKGGVWLSQEEDAPQGIEPDARGYFFILFHDMLSTEGQKTASFWVSGLCTPWKTFGDRAASLVSARLDGSPSKEQAVVNTCFGELFNVSGDAPPWQAVKAKQGRYSENEIPLGCQFLTSGVDVGQDIIYGVIRGWGFNKESWLIEKFQLHGPTDQPEIWTKLYQHLENGRGGMPIARVLVDSGYKPGGKTAPVHMVYEFCARHAGWAIPVKGRKTMSKPYAFSDITDKHTKAAQLKLCLVHSDHFKSWVHNRIGWETGVPGDWHVHANITDDYCQQVTAEARLVLSNNQVYWVKLRKDNHFFDCEYYATCAAEIENVSGLQPLPEQLAQIAENEKNPLLLPTKAPAKRKGRKVRGRGKTD